MQPGQFFTEYLDNLPKLKKAMHPADYMIADATATTFRSNGVLFVLPPGGETTDRRMKTISGEMLRPPYKHVVLEYKALEGRLAPDEIDCPKRIVLAADLGDTVHILPCLYNASAGRWVPHIYMGVIDLTNKNVLYMENNAVNVRVKYSPCLPKAFERNRMDWLGSTDSFMQQVCTDLRDEVNAYIDFCYALHKHEVTYDETEPDRAKNRFRRARGKAPLFTYKTLTIGKKKRKSQHLGGTHASPRSHLRRGHYRTSSKGVRYWVQPCMVKGETDGFVHKDYIVEAVEA
jgi:hypothetical protein